MVGSRRVSDSGAGEQQDEDQREQRAVHSGSGAEIPGRRGGEERIRSSDS